MIINSVSDIPSPNVHYFQKSQKWSELIGVLNIMKVGQCICVTLPNKKEAQSGQAITSGKHLKGIKNNAIYTTRTSPASSNPTGEWFLWIKRSS